MRVETDRGGPDYFLDDWTEDTSTGRLFKDYPLELTGSNTEIEQEIEVIENGGEEDDWSYWASIRTIEDWEGNTLTGAEEAEYWTVKQGFRETTIDGTDSGGATGTVSLTTAQTEVYEGEEVLFTLTRSGGPMGEAMTVRLTSRESNHQTGTINQSKRVHEATFEPCQSTATLKILAYVDGVTEEGSPDPLRTSLEGVGIGYEIGNPAVVVVEINDPPSNSVIIDISFTSDIVDEGDVAIFTLSRSGDMSSGVTVNLLYEDSFDVLRGNH